MTTTTTESGAPVAAIVSLVLGILGFCTLGMTGVIGVVFGLVALRGSGGGRGGRGVAVGGLAVSASSILASAVALAMIWPKMAADLDSANSVLGQTRALQVGQAATIYAREFDGTIPVDDWVNVLIDRGYIQSDILEHPSARGGGRAFALNDRLRGVVLSEVDDPQSLVMVFECTTGAAPAGGPELLPTPPHHERGHVVVFVDGGAEIVDPAMVDSLRWVP